MTAVATVEVEQDGRPVEVELSPIPADLIERLDLRRPFSFFIAFPGHAEHRGSLEVTARDSDGRVLARYRMRGSM